MRTSILLPVILLLVLVSPVAAKFDPSFRWTTLETPHFLIHYHQAGEPIARKAARIAEDVHARLVPRIAWEPKQKTHLVLVDAADLANGMASPVPYNQMIIYLTHPLGEPGFGLTQYDDWLRLVITHEYAHILQLDMVTGVPRVVQKVLGRIYFPNMFQPLWMIEGLATYEETEQTSGGRGRSPGAEMILRMAALEGPFPSLDQASVFLDSWPGGQIPYLFGESFTRYLAEKHGRDRLAGISEEYSGRWLPFLVESTGRRVLQRGYEDLWSEWEGMLNDRYRAVAEEIRAQGMSASISHTERGYFNIAPAYSPDGSRIAYTVVNADEFPAVYLMNADGSGDRKVVENVTPLGASGSAVSWSPDGRRLYYTKNEIWRNSSYYNDIYTYDLEKKREVRLTKGLRARDPHPSPDGKQLLFVLNRMGMTRLAMLDLPAGRRRMIKENEITFLTEESMNQYSNPRFSPGGNRIAVSVWQPGGNVDIWIFDGQGNKLTEISRDRAFDGAPAWSPDGKHLFFSSDRTGIVNLYAYEIAAKKLFRVTNVIGGAFTPCPSPDGKTLAFSSYGGKGYEIHSIPVDRSSWSIAGPYADPYPAVRYDEKQVETTVKPYGPLSTIYPRFWLPWFGYSDESGWLFGLFTFGQDVVQRHSYFLNALYGPESGRTWYGFDYFYDGLYPTLHLHASDIDVTYSDLLVNPVEVKNYTEIQRTYSGSVIIPLLTNARQHYLTLGYRWREFEGLTDTTGFVPKPAEGVLASTWISYEFNSARRYDFSISPEQGRTIELGYELFDESLGSDYEIDKYTADWHEYITLPWKHHVLLARAFVGTSTGDVLPQGTFQLGGQPLGDITLSTEDVNVSLRGYPVNTFRGTKAMLATLEYRFPLTNIEGGWDTKPLFLRRLHGAIFGDAGNAWEESFRSSELKWGVGAELGLDMYLAYYLPITLTLGVADGLDEGGETNVYFGLAVPVLY